MYDKFTQSYSRIGIDNMDPSLDNKLHTTANIVTGSRFFIAPSY
jgi:hypothetical protein